MKSKNITLGIASIFALLLVISFAGAELTLNNASSIPENVNHGEEKEIELNTSYDGNEEEIDLDWSVENSDYWTSLPSLESITNTSAETTSAKFKIPKYTNPGEVELNITADNESESEHASYVFDINVPEDHSLSINTNGFNGENTTTITIENTGNVDLENISLTSIENDFSVNLTSEDITNLSDFNLNAGESAQVKAELLDEIEDLKYGENSIKIKAEYNDEVVKQNLVYERDFSEISRTEDMKISDFEYELIEGYGEGDDETGTFYPLDKIKVTFTAELDSDYEIDDATLDAIILNESGEEVATKKDIDFSDDEFDLDDDEDEKELELTFNIDESFLEKNREDFDQDYTLLIKAEGKLEGDKAEEDNLEGNETGISHSSEFSVEEGSVHIGNLDIRDSVPCKSEIQFKPDIRNFQTSELDEGDVFIKVYNEELSINEVVEIDEDLNSLEKSNFEVRVKIPEGVEGKEYSIEFTPYEKYENGEFEDQYENGEEGVVYTSDIEVSGRFCGTLYGEETKSEMIKLTSVSGEEAGDEFVVNATISNPEDEQVTYDLTNMTVPGEWADSVSMNPTQITLNPGEEKEVEITAKSNENSIGEQFVKWNVKKQGQEVASYEFPVNVEESTGIKDWDWKQILNVVLVLGIISVLVTIILKAGSKSKKPGKAKKQNSSHVKKAIEE